MLGSHRVNEGLEHTGPFVAHHLIQQLDVPEKPTLGLNRTCIGSIILNDVPKGDELRAPRSLVNNH